MGAALGLGLYYAPEGHIAGLDRRADLLLHDASLLLLRQHTQLDSKPLEDLSSDNPQLRLVTIDEASLHEAQRDALGQYRVQRDVYARLVDRLRAGGARVVAFNLQFAADAEVSAEDLPLPVCRPPCPMKFRKTKPGQLRVV
jgi:CHASE2 domain-containing sensor protein